MERIGDEQERRAKLEAVEKVKRLFVEVYEETREVSC